MSAAHLHRGMCPGDDYVSREDLCIRPETSRDVYCPACAELDAPAFEYQRPSGVSFSIGLTTAPADPAPVATEAPSPDARHACCASHCCAEHGCKYSHFDCPVVTRKVIQENECEECEAAEDGESSDWASRYKQAADAERAATERAAAAEGVLAAIDTMERSDEQWAL